MLEKIQALLLSLDKQSSSESFCHEIKKAQLSYEDLDSYLYFDKHKYTRNLIFQSPKFELMTLCWGGNQETPIHDHNGSLGVMQVIQGELHETLYKENPTSGCLIKMEERKAGEGFITSIEDSIGYHKIANKSEQPAVSLHFYAKPIECFYTYNSKNLEKCLKTPCFYSEFGEQKERVSL